MLAKFTLARSNDGRCRLVTLCPILLSDKAVERISKLLAQMPSNNAGTERLHECLDFLQRGQREGIVALCPSTSLGDWEGPSLRSTRPTVEIPASPCIIGSDRGDTERAEAPARSVLVDTFLLDKHPVTNRDYAAFLAHTGYPRAKSAPSSRSREKEAARPGWRR